MKLRVKSLSGAAVSLLALAVFLALLIFPVRYAHRVSEGVSLWAISVLPVTLPFLFLTLFLSRLPAYARVSRRLSPLFSRLFRVSGAGGCAAVLSVLSGYPAGARAVLDLSARGALAREERFRTACLATTSGPAFLVGTLGSIAGTAVGWLLFAAHLLGVWTVSFLLGRRASPLPAAPPPVRADADNALTESLSAAVLSVLAVGGAIALFYAFGYMVADALAPLSLPATAAAVLQGLIEMTSGCVLLLQDPTPLHVALCAFLVTFGGMCVLVQEWSFLKKTGVRLPQLLAAKAAQGLAAGIAAYAFALLL